MGSGYKRLTDENLGIYVSERLEEAERLRDMHEETPNGICENCGSSWKCDERKAAEDRYDHWTKVGLNLMRQQPGDR